MSFSPLAIALLRLDALSDMVTRHKRVKGCTSLRNAIEKIFDEQLKNLDIDPVENSLYATIVFQDGSMTVMYEKGDDVLQLINVAYNGGRCESVCCTPVPEFIENLEVLSESDWFSDGNNGVPLDEAGKKLLHEMRRLARSPEFRDELIPSN